VYNPPQGGARRRPGEKLKSYFKRIDKKTPNVSEEDAEATLQEALKKVRPEYHQEE